jgi:putative membrane protein
VIPISAIPAVNATLNAISAVLLLVGFRAIRRREIARHRIAMGAAFATSVLFLVSYVIYHVNAGSKHYAGGGALRAIYLIVLATHVALAAVVVPLAAMTLALALRGSFARHRRLARWTLPVWLYVSATGVFVYAMLYHGPGR